MQPLLTRPQPPFSASPDTTRAPPRRRPRLVLEIALALCLKAVLLVILHQLWFAHPQSKRLTDSGVAAALFGAPPAESIQAHDRPPGAR